ncbi:BSD domain-containing protein [Coccidioides immitis H538.4]|uniref:BSD domain-containing protein n=1 Tax=Coccidioides immitis H538.4 TaxID=396776 RepID=A0A0J8RF37_COCIT|nr:BSD domain-containing protein [Coccidioides immitis H538.4]
MDVAYDHIQEEILASPENDKDSKPGDADPSETSSRHHLGAEFQETFNAFSASPWGARLGGLWGNVRRQGESYYEEARQEYSTASQEAIRGFSDLRNSIIGRTRGLSLGGFGAGGEGDDDKDKAVGSTTPTSPKAGDSLKDSARDGAGETQDADGDGFISRFRAEAAKRLKDIERAEDAADEALLRFGNNIRNFLRDSVSLFHPRKRAARIHRARCYSRAEMRMEKGFEAQLHAIHSNLESFSKDPDGGEWGKWKDEFKIDSKTDVISKDLETYPELRRAMENLVPEKVEYADFWRRYYFLRMVIETEEKRRKELLQASTAGDDEEVAWDEDSESEPESPTTPQVKINKASEPPGASSLPTSSSMSNENLKPLESRNSNDQQSQADSDASYDLVSGATSRTPGSPKETEKSATSPAKAVEVSSDEEDWE